MNSFHIIFFALFFSSIFTYEQKFIEIEFDKENIKKITPNGNEDFEIVNTSYVHLKKNNEYYKLETLHDLQYQPLFYLPEIEKTLKLLQYNGIISRADFGVLDNKVYYGGLNKKILGDRFKDKMELNLKFQINSNVYYFEIFHSFIEFQNGKSKLFGEFKENYYGDLNFNSEDDFTLSAPLKYFDLLYQTPEFKQCKFINPTEPNRPPTHIECSNEVIEKIKNKIPYVSFEFGEYELYAKTENLFKDNKYFISKGSEMGRWLFNGGFCKHFAININPDARKLTIFFNANEIKYFILEKHVDQHRLLFGNIIFYLFIGFIVIFALGKIYFNSKTKRRNVENDNAEELISI
jgi:hypothetical protein